MGHDIHAYRAEDKTTDPEEIAYLRRNIGDPYSNTIYQILNCEELNGGWSGVGEDRVFSRSELLNALGNLSAKTNGDPKYDPEERFIEDRLKACKACNGDIRILIR